MTNDNREKEVLNDALAMPVDQRAEFIREACGNDAELLARVDALLQANDEVTGPFGIVEPAGSGTQPETPDQIEKKKSRPQPRSIESDLKGQTIAGRYKLLQKLGEGGMGEVWLAEQREPVKRLVAVKIIRTGQESRQAMIRFEAERQALAMMDHPNIAKVLDGGVTAGEPGGVSPGVPFFVMELVKGIPITKYCDQEHLNPEQRLELFSTVCQAVQYAHQKGIIHRDLKPSNIMIALYDGKPIPKVIDFGVAKAMNQKLTDKTLYTEIGQIIGTLEYMAPEQAELNNLDIDTRADVYSLGTILYELLSGSTPFTSEELRTAGMLEMLRRIREVDPPSPSTRLSNSDALPSIAAKRKLEPKRLTKEISGELDWIVMKCLTKERSRRYDTANSLAADIKRYLMDEPVEAGPPSARYRLEKFYRRHRVEVLMGSLAMLAIICGAVIASWQAWEAKREARRADDKTIEAKTSANQAKEETARAERALSSAVAANARLLAAADDKEFAAAFPQFAANGDRGLPILRGIADAEIPADADAEVKEKLAKQRSTALIALMRFGEVERIWPLLKFSTDPTIRSYLVNRFAPLGVDPTVLIERLTVEADLSSRRALILSLGEFNETQLPMEQRQALIPKLQAIYRDPDPGLHAAAEWLLRSWKQDDWLKHVNDESAKHSKTNGRADAPRSPGQSPSWHVNSQGQTMIAFRGPVEFLMGSPVSESGRIALTETQHLRRIPRSFAIAATHVTFDQYRKFDPKFKQSEFCKTGDSPVTAVTWHQAAAYCNWLSEQEGIQEEQWCYEIDAGIVAKMKPNYLSLSGYRLPTEAEWEYAVRAEAGSAFSFGDPEELLRHYGWFTRNAQSLLHPAGRLKPNDFGLFDGHGSAWCWCQNVAVKYFPAATPDKPVEDADAGVVVKSTDARALRGGTFNYVASFSRSSNRYSNVPAYRFDNFGFRPVRTLPLIVQLSIIEIP